MFLIACGDDGGLTDDPPVDSGTTRVDSGTSADAGSDPADGGSDGEDAGMDPDGGPTDAGVAVDAFTPADSGADDDMGIDVCEGVIVGTPCRSGCSRGFQCVDGICLPSAARETCGGVAGARCTDTRTFTNCVFLAGADFGPCLSNQERDCVCGSDRSSRFQCRSTP